MNLNHLWRTACATIALVACTAAQAADNGVTVSIAPQKNMLGAAEDVVVKVTVANHSAVPQYVLKWQMPFGAVQESLFDVTRDGARVPYLGRHYKRGTPTAADYYVLNPGSSYTANVELSALYDMSVTGEYSIRFRSASLDLFGNGKQSMKAAIDREVGEIGSDAVTLWIDGSLPRGSMTPTEKAMAMSPSAHVVAAAGTLAFTQCSASQQSTITSAISAGKTMATNGSTYMTNGVIGTRYTKWFGANNSSRVATIKSHFAALKDAFANKPITVDCGCTDSYYAYVYPTQPYKIYVCNAFWSAPMTGTDSKGGTLVHEMSHFNVVASTDDWAYGQSAAASLAIKNPSKAIDNADSHEYFGENTPALN